MTRNTLSSIGTTSRCAAATDRSILSNAPIAMLLTSVLVLATSSCGGAGSSIVGSTMQDVQSFQATGGNNQNGTAGSTLPTPLTVRASTKGGQGVSGISVQWTFSAGGGSLTSDGTVSQSLTTVTNKQGKSSVYWQLDTIAGDQTATATLSGTSSNSTTSVKFHSRGKAGGAAALVVSPKVDTLAVGDSAQFTATVLDRWKNVISGALVSWSSSNSSVLSVSSTGMAKALRSGSARVIASTSAPATTSPSVSAAGGSIISAGASVSVQSSLTTGTGTPTVTVTPASLFFASLDATAPLSAVAKDSTGNTVTNPGFTWKSLATSIATVSTAGLVTAKALGATAVIVTAACCGSDTVPVTVDTTSQVHANEPAGFTPLFHVDGTTKNWGPLISSYGKAWATNVSVVTDPSAPSGKAVQDLFPAGHGAGFSGAAFIKNLGGPFRRLYIRVVFEFNPTWQQSPSGGTKLFYYGSSSKSNAYYPLMWTTAWELRWRDQASGANAGVYQANPAVYFPVGKYHTLEILHVMESSSGAHDGYVKIWMDGNYVRSWNWLGHNITEDLGTPNYNWEQGLLLNAMQLGVYWGGSGGTKAHDDWVRWGDIYVSGSKQ